MGAGAFELRKRRPTMNHEPISRQARLLMLSAVLLSAACNSPEPGSEPMEGSEVASTAKPVDHEDETRRERSHLIATLEGKSGSALSGEVMFMEADGDDVSFTLRVQNAPAGVHAVHIHENGDCSAPDASSAGGHWNPTSENHGRRGEGSFHAGDIENLEVGVDGTGSLSMTVADWSLEETGGESVIGKALVVHAGADDFRTQPDGAAGDRIGCGVIERSGANPSTRLGARSRR
jgi:Cu-Zn family superoxide dismutase